MPIAIYCVICYISINKREHLKKQMEDRKMNECFEFNSGNGMLLRFENGTHSVYDLREWQHPEYYPNIEPLFCGNYEDCIAYIQSAFYEDAEQCLF